MPRGGNRATFVTLAVGYSAARLAASVSTEACGRMKMMMSSAYVGGCACGAVRYEIHDKPVFENHCQCRDCQRRSGTGHGSYLTFADRSRVRVTGEAKTWRVAGDSGNEKIHGFCGNCGTPVHLTFAAMPA